MPQAPTGEPSWLLLIHQIPPKPNYLRVKIGRRLQKLGSVAIKNSVYALPSSDQAREDLNWVLREIVEARFVEGLSEEQVRELFPPRATPTTTRSARRRGRSPGRW